MDDEPAPEILEIDLRQAVSPEAVSERLDSARDGGARVALLHGRPEWSPGEAWLRTFERSVLPTVFGFDGRLEDAGLGLALHCDIRVCAADASMRVTGIGGRRLLLLIGEHGMVELMRARGQLDAEGALRLGLVSKVGPAGRGVETAREAAAVIASRGPIAVQLGKEAIWRGLDLPLEQALRFETDLTLLLQTTKDRAEGVAAFLEKRPPRFTGE